MPAHQPPEAGGNSPRCTGELDLYGGVSPVSIMVEISLVCFAFIKLKCGAEVHVIGRRGG